MKLSTRAKVEGRNYKTERCWWLNGFVPVLAYEGPTHAVLVRMDEQPKPVSSAAAPCARLSSPEQKSDLDTQQGQLAAFAAGMVMTVIASVTEFATGLEGLRTKFMSLLADPALPVIVFEHLDRLMLFGVEYVEAAPDARGTCLSGIEPDEVRDKSGHDMIEELASSCMRLYGRRSAKNKAKKALQAIHE